MTFLIFMFGFKSDRMSAFGRFPIFSQCAAYGPLEGLRSGLPGQTFQCGGLRVLLMVHVIIYMMMAWELMGKRWDCRHRGLHPCISWSPAPLPTSQLPSLFYIFPHPHGSSLCACLVAREQSMCTCPRYCMYTRDCHINLFKYKQGKQHWRRYWSRTMIINDQHIGPTRIKHIHVKKYPRLRQINNISR